MLALCNEHKTDNCHHGSGAAVDHDVSGFPGPGQEVRYRSVENSLVPRPCRLLADMGTRFSLADHRERRHPPHFPTGTADR